MIPIDFHNYFSEGLKPPTRWDMETNITIENHHFEEVNKLFLWGIFNSYVKLPQGNGILRQTKKISRTRSSPPMVFFPWKWGTLGTPHNLSCRLETNDTPLAFFPLFWDKPK